MVAISLYRGNLHRVPDGPRTWRMPPRIISVAEFKALLEKRSKTLAQLQHPETATDAAEAAEEEGMGESGCPKVEGAEEPKEVVQDAEIGRDEAEIARPASDVPKSVVEGKAIDNPEANIPVDQRKRDLEEKLYVLNEKKHHLVQMLKQILNAEEEMKRKTIIQTSSVRSNFPPQNDPMIENGTSMKITPPKMTVEVNFGEMEDNLIHGAQGRNLTHIQSPSPSPVSPFNKPTHGFFHTSGNPSKGIPASTSHGSMMVSPSRFGPQGHLSHGTNQSMVSISGTPLLASSPSPVGSGGAASVFRESRLTSP